jgi:hypothetical protein
VETKNYLNTSLVLFCVLSVYSTLSIKTDLVFQVCCREAHLKISNLSRPESGAAVGRSGIASFQNPDKWCLTPRTSVPTSTSQRWMDIDSSNDVEDLFEDSLRTIFGDVPVSHGEPGTAFVYKTRSKGY